MVCINLMNENDLIVIYKHLLISFILIYGCPIVAYNRNENKLNGKETIKEKKRIEKEKTFIAGWLYQPGLNVGALYTYMTLIVLNVNTYI